MRLSKTAPSRALLASMLASSSQLASAFYIPGVAPTSYKPDELVPLHVNTIKPLMGSDTMLHSVVSYDYYNPRFHFCQPEGGPKDVRESLGGILFGDRIKTSPFELHMKHNESCKALCEVTYSKEAAAFVNNGIKMGLSFDWLVDGLPAGQRAVDQYTGKEFYAPGFYMGYWDEPNNQVLFNNHYEIMVDYHEVGGNPEELRVVGVLVQPYSRKYSARVTEDACEREMPVLTLDENGDTVVRFSYSVYWRSSPKPWATRADNLADSNNPSIHWLSLIASSIIVVVLVATVMSILFRALRKDFARYNRLDQINLEDLSGTSALEDGVQEDSGWKLVHGDVFRTPSHPLLLSVLLGSGAQLIVMTGLTLCFALLGFVSPDSRGSLGTIMILLYTLSGFVAGYASSRVYKSLQGENWKLNIVLTPLLIPSVVFATFFLLNLFLWGKESSGAVPFGTMLLLVLIWFVISVPLSFAGSWLGFKAKALEPPVRTNQIPRQIPPAMTYLQPIPSVLMVGILPFFAVFVELYFILSSIWFSRVYFMFGFLFLCYGLTVVTCASVTVLMIYFLLCSENYNWQWRSFFAAGASAGYVFLYSLYYWVSNMSLSTLTGGVLYFGYSFLISFLFFILTGESTPMATTRYGELPD